jgi:hypothetical protein
MLRRYEIYAIDPGAPQERVSAMERAMRDAHRYIPEVLHSAVGYNKSPVQLSFVWEHAYASPAAYQRYMVHPFHANIYDRFLLNDSPERIVVNNRYDVGLLCYNCESAVYLLPPGAARRLVLLRLKPGAAQAFESIAEKARMADPNMMQSVIGENTFATRWLDGVTQILKDTTYTHIWEQGYASLAQAQAASSAWKGEAGDLIEQVIELWYELKTGEGYERSPDRT